MIVIQSSIVFAIEGFLMYKYLWRNDPDNKNCAL